MFGLVPAGRAGVVPEGDGLGPGPLGDADGLGPLPVGEADGEGGTVPVQQSCRAGADSRPGRAGPRCRPPPEPQGPGDRLAGRSTMECIRSAAPSNAISPIATHE